MRGWVYVLDVVGLGGEAWRSQGGGYLVFIRTLFGPYLLFLARLKSSDPKMTTGLN